MTRRHYIDNSPTVYLTAPVGTGDLTINLSSLTGFPSSFPWVATLDLGQPTAEQVLVTSSSGVVATVTRNYNSQGASAHITNSTFDHTFIAVDADDANSHVNASSGVHGLAGSVVGTTDAQTLSSKTLTTPTITGPTITGAGTAALASVTASGTVQGATVTATGAVNGVTAAISTSATVGTTLGVTGLTTATGGVAAQGTASVPAVTGTSATGGASFTAKSHTGSTVFNVDDTGTITGASALGVLGAITGGSASVTGTSTGQIQTKSYTNEAARTAAWAAPVAGAISFLTNPTTGVVGVERQDIYDGSAWVPVSSMVGKLRLTMSFTSAATALTAGANIPFPNTIEDTATAWSATNKNFVCPVAGRYLVTASATHAAVTNGLVITKNGANDTVGPVVASALGCSVTGYLNCVATDTIAITPQGTVTTSSTTYKSTFLEIIYLGP